jgi:5-oxoprolinase (ATP-hydrolysing)
MGGEKGVGDKSRVVEEEVRLITLMDQGHWVKAKSIDRAVLKMGDRLVGPVLIRSVGSTTILNGGWQGEVVEDGVLLMSRLKGDSDGVRNGETESREADLGVIDPILRDVLAQRVGAIAEQMGIVLEQTALSVNVKQRRDFSCAVFNARGELIANAPHVPVHLGAMGRTVQAMIEVFPEMRPGDCYVTNDPYRGGSHLPDVTVVTPVFIERGNESIGKRGGDKPDFFVASRAHHAEIGGVAPGSMAPTSKRLGEEGVILSPMHLTFRGEDLSDQVEARLRGGEYPSRSVGENMADLWAQRAANQRGMLAMQDLASAMGVGELHRYFDAILRVAEVKTRAWIGSLAKDEYFFRDSMEHRF